MTQIFIHIESLLSVPTRPYRLAACTLDRNRVFEANIFSPGVEGHPDELSRKYRVGESGGTSDGSVVGTYAEKGQVMDMFHLWLEGCPGKYELWTKSVQQSWREFNALGLHALPIYDLSTFVRLGGLDFAMESVVAHRSAGGKAGATSPRLGAYEQAILFETVRRKTSILK
jgi:hypothetical protein